MATQKHSPQPQFDPDAANGDASNLPDDARPHTKHEQWLEGRTIVDAREFLDDAGNRWRQLRLDDGTAVQVLLTHPWLVLTP